MNWRQIEAEWDGDPEFRRSYEEEYPFDAVARSIVRLRAEHGLTQEQLARLANSSQSVIARAETGRHGVNVSLLNRIARAVGTTWEPVFGMQRIPLQPYTQQPVAATLHDWVVEAFLSAPALNRVAIEHHSVDNTTLDAKTTYRNVSAKIIRLEGWIGTGNDVEPPEAANKQPALALAG
ncbi:MAG: helix-turn-helix transcriptional regulator [Isosphaeraceae bacterium]|nr:helix-turn-helix transcriptional regulator [Isosphaeraceae bacterium]